MLSLSCSLGNLGASVPLQWVKAQIQVLPTPRCVCYFLQGLLAFIWRLSRQVKLPTCIRQQQLLAEVCLVPNQADGMFAKGSFCEGERTGKWEERKMKTLHTRNNCKKRKASGGEIWFEERKLGIQELDNITSFSKGELRHSVSAQRFHSSFPKRTQVPQETVLAI